MGLPPESDSTGARRRSCRVATVWGQRSGGDAAATEEELRGGLQSAQLLLQQAQEALREQAEALASARSKAEEVVALQVCLALKSKY